MAADLRGTAPPRPLTGQRPGPPAHPPVEGVDYRTWLTVSAGLRKDAVHDVHVDSYAAHRGVPPGRWPAVDAAWTRRSAEDPDVGAWSAYDIRRLIPTGSTWEVGA